MLTQKSTKMTSRKKSAESVIKDIKRKTRMKFSPEEKSGS